MKHYAGLDVSIKETSVCVLDEGGRIVREVKVPSHPDDLAPVLLDLAHPLDRVGLEAGPLSQWLFTGLAEKGVPVVCIETRHTKAFLKAQPNKSDRNDARGIAQMMRVNLFRPVSCKDVAQPIPARAPVGTQAPAGESDRLRERHPRVVRNFGLKVGAVGSGGFEARIRELVDDRPELQEIMLPLLAARRTLRDRFAELHRRLLAEVKDDRVCRQLMTIPGVGPVVSLAFTATIDVPARFRNARSVGPALGLTPTLHQSGETNRVGRISLCGDAMMRSLLYEAAQVLPTRVSKWSWLEARAMAVARRRGLRRAIVALARRLAVIMHRMWRDGADFRWTRCAGQVA